LAAEVNLSETAFAPTTTSSPACSVRPPAWGEETGDRKRPPRAGAVLVASARPPDRLPGVAAGGYVRVALRGDRTPLTGRATTVIDGDLLA
jgi:hypothetical protein